MEREPSALCRRLRAILALTVCLVIVPIARADGGLLASTAVRDGRLIAVFAAPTPPRVGVLDISILIQDLSTGRPLLDVPVAVVAYPTDGDHKKLRTAATREAATNKLLRAAQLDLYQAGAWQVEITPQNLSGEPIRFTIDVQAAPPAWFDMASWFAWPLAAIALFATHQWLVQRRIIR